MKQVFQNMRQTASIALGILLVMAWAAPAASACGACAHSVEATCCMDAAAPPPCPCDALAAGIPIPVEMPDCCPCGMQEAPEPAVVVSAAVPPAPQPFATAMLSTALTMTAMPAAPCCAAAASSLHPRPAPAYLLDCALLR